MVHVKDLPGGFEASPPVARETSPEAGFPHHPTLTAGDTCIRFSLSEKH
jgi:hypothetical protein